MNDRFLEQFYEYAILTRYEDIISTKKVEWIDHGKVGLDAWAHHFKTSGRKYILLYEDFPDGSYFEGDPSHELIKCGYETSIELRFSDDTKQVPNVTGWFTLFQQK